jgi:hypothetical protein
MAKGQDSCSITIRREQGKIRDVMVFSPCDGPAKVVDRGRGLDEGIYTVVLPDRGGGSSGKCEIYGQSGTGSAALTSATITKASGTPYTVATYVVKG